MIRYLEKIMQVSFSLNSESDSNRSMKSHKLEWKYFR